VGNPAEETYCYPNNLNIMYFRFSCQLVIPKHSSRCIPGLVVASRKLAPNFNR
jgi:hypothetical protein